MIYFCLIRQSDPFAEEIFAEYTNHYGHIIFYGGSSFGPLYAVVIVQSVQFSTQNILCFYAVLGISFIASQLEC